LSANRRRLAGGIWSPLYAPPPARPERDADARRPRVTRSARRRAGGRTGTARRGGESA